MVYTNTGFSAHPLANPFNCRPSGNYNMIGFGYGRKSSVRLDPNAKLPEAKLGGEQQSNKLTVPNQLGAELGISRIDTIGMAQMFPNLVVCPDGTMLDAKTRKVIVDPTKNAPDGQWAPTKIIKPPQIVNQSDSQHLNFSSTSDASTNSLSLNDVDSMRYWQEQQATQQKPMTAEQEKLLADLEAGKIMKLSRLELIDERLKTKI